ncbi:MAG: hypothetical protein ACRDQ7_05220 [Haloechinothrix sp.]
MAVIAAELVERIRDLTVRCTATVGQSRNEIRRTAASVLPPIQRCSTDKCLMAVDDGVRNPRRSLAYRPFGGGKYAAVGDP